MPKHTARQRMYVPVAVLGMARRITADVATSAVAHPRSDKAGTSYDGWLASNLPSRGGFLFPFKASADALCEGAAALRFAQLPSSGSGNEEKAPNFRGLLSMGGEGTKGAKLLSWEWAPLAWECPIFSAGGSLASTLLNRVTMLALLLAAAALYLVRRRAIALPTWSWRQIAPFAGIGILGSAGDLLFSIGTTRDLLSVVSLIGSMSPLVTVGLATIVLKERLVRYQTLDVASALLGIAFLSLR